MELTKPCDEVWIRIECPTASVDNLVRLWAWDMRDEEKDTRYAILVGAIYDPTGLLLAFRPAPDIKYKLRLFNEDGRPEYGTVTAIGIEHRQREIRQVTEGDLDRWDGVPIGANADDPVGCVLMGVDTVEAWREEGTI